MRHLLATSLLASIALAGPACAADFTLESPVLAPGASLGAEQVLDGFGCTGGNRSPALTWHTPPPGTRSFAITVHDPDAPTGSGWWHWVVHDLPADTRGLPVGAGAPAGTGLPPPAVQGRTDFGTQGYGGACPPAGDPPHRYRFTVHALKVERLGAPPDATAAMIGFLLHQHRIGQATIEVRYGR
ncbi:MAG: YbhB/YbcL family Raf kinase inhibitor-like protein [Rhizobacter sp.]